MARNTVFFNNNNNNNSENIKESDYINSYKCNKSDSMTNSYNISSDNNNLILKFSYSPSFWNFRLEDSMHRTPTSLGTLAG